MRRPWDRWNATSLRVRMVLIVFAGVIAAVVAIQTMAARTTSPAPAIELAGQVDLGAGGLHLVDGQVVDHLGPGDTSAPRAGAGTTTSTGDPTEAASADDGRSGDGDATTTEDHPAATDSKGSDSPTDPSSPKHKTTTSTPPGASGPTGVPTTLPVSVGVTIGPVGPVTPPVTLPPLTLPPVTLPPVTLPPVTDPPVTDPPVTDPPITVPPITVPPITVPPITVEL